MVDYVRLLATANKLINRNGRLIVLSRTTRNSEDPSRPWRGRAATTVDPLPPFGVTNPFPSISIRGVFVPPNTVREFGITSLGEGTLMEDMIKVSQQIVIVAGTLLPTQTDFREFTIIQDRSENWGIQAMQVLRPGDITLLAFIGVRR